MINRREFVLRATGLVVAGVSVRELAAESPDRVVPLRITVYKTSTCVCCAKWVDHLRESGFDTTVHDKGEAELQRLKDELGVPQKVRSCHTAVVDRYLIEGHVPAGDIERVAKERPRVAGLAVPGMPPRTPGMAMPGEKTGDFEVISFQADGKTQVFARY
jgi:hypothetical protein